MSWLVSQIRPFALKPGGAALWPLFWVVAVLGLGALIRKRPALGLGFAAVPLSAWPLAGLRFVPLYERLSLWVVPALYVGIASFGDEVVHIAAESRRRGQRWRYDGAVVLATLLAALGIDIAEHGIVSLRGNRPAETNHSVNDRVALGWILSQRRTGDDVLTTRNGLPAVWWYGHVPISGPYRGGGFDDGRGRVLEIEPHDPGDPICETNRTLDEVFVKDGRAIVYFGFRAGDEPTGYDDRILSFLRERGKIVSDRRLKGTSRVTILELTGSHEGQATQATSGTYQTTSAGCIVVKPGERW